MMRVFCGIVTYNPDIDILLKNVKVVYSQVAKIIIVDNASNNISLIKKVVLEFDNMVVIENKNNFGVAKALNQIMEFASSQKVEWVLTLDQDSVVSTNYVSNLIVPEIDRVGIFCPRIYDRERKCEDLSSGVDEQLIEVDKCITSGSIVNTDIWRRIGGFDEILFIDGVDFDFCHRVRQAEYKIIKNQLVVLDHSIGNGKIIKIGSHTIQLSIHNAFRIYFICRNKVYCDYKYKKKYSFKTCLSILKILIQIIFFEKEKCRKLKAAIKGVKDGIVLVNNNKKNNIT